ncbi:MAG: 3-deoxy-manno-octulosonate-8-phosphatase KdsC [Gammaproteobacteria bacterium]
MAPTEPFQMKDIIEKAKRIRLVIFDVDGVLTDGKLIFDESGREYKCFNTKDGHGIKMLHENGIATAVISGRKSPAVALRMASLGVKHVFQGREDKTNAFDELRAQLPVVTEQIAYVGDDLPDIPVFARVGLAIAVADAHITVRQHADWCTTLPGGCGAAREVCDLVLLAQERLETSIDGYLAL